MSLKMKSIIAGAFAIMILVVMLIMLLQEPQNDANLVENMTPSSSASSTQDTNVLALINKDSSMIESISVKNKVDEYVIEKLDEDVWGIDELRNFNLVTNYSSMLRTVSSLTAVEIVEEDASDLSKFGFDDPTLVIDVFFSDSKTYQITVGDIVNATNTAYVILDNNPTVYRFFPSNFNEYLLAKKSLISTNIIGALPTYDYGTADPDYTYMKLERQDLSTPWVFEKYQSKTDIILTIPAYLQFSSPVSADIDAERFPKYFENYFGLSALSVEAYNPTVEMLTDYGFDDPYAKFATVYGGGEMEFTLIVGDEFATSGYDARYIMLEGTELVYVIETSYLPFLTVNSSDILSSMLVLESLYGFVEVKVTTAGKTAVFEAWEEDNVVVQNDNGDYVYEDGVLVVNCNGELIDTDFYKQYIQNLFLTGVTDITNTKPTGNPDISIEYTYLDGSIETVEVYEQKDRTTIIILNGKDYFTGRSGYVDSVKAAQDVLFS